MGALPRPAVPDGPVRAFFDVLHEQHHRAGWPSLRAMAREVGCSHTTISAAFSGPNLPRWGLVELIAEMLGGDVARFHDLWLAAGRTIVPAPPDTPPAGPVTASLVPVAPTGDRAARPRQLPGDVSAFTGREAQLADLDRLHAEAAAGTTAVPILALSGTAGVGKTALAVHWAHRVAAAFPDGQLYINLRGYDRDSPVRASEALETFLRALGVPDAAVPPGLDARAARYRTLLADRRVLVLLDNAHSAGQVRDLLPGTPRCLVLVTSRSTLPGLVARDGAIRIDLDVLSAAEAVALLRRLVGPRLDAEPGQAAELAARCARLPLALRIAAELAAARRSVPLAGLVAELGDESRRLDLLAAGEDDYTAVRAVFSWSCRHLPADVLAAFQSLGAHPGRDIDVDAAAALFGAGRSETYRLLEALLRVHLLEESAPGRYGMHDLLRAYAQERSTGHPGRGAALARLFDHYLETAGRAAEGARWDDGWLTAERPNLLAVAAAAAEVSPRHTWELSGRLAEWLDTRAHYRDGLTLHGLAARAARAAGDRAGEAGALVRLGTAHMRTGAYPEAIDHYRRALAAHRETGDLAGQAAALHGLGTMAWRLGDTGEARGHLEAALAIRRGLGDRPGEGASLYNLGTVFRQLGDYPRALAHQRGALEIYRECGDRIGESRVLNNLGTTLERMGEYERAFDHYRQALTRNREIGNQVGEAVALTNLGWSSARLGRFAEAMARHEEALPLYRRCGYRVGEADGLHGIGALHLWAGRGEEAVPCLRRAVALAHEIGDVEVEAGALVDLGEALRALGRDEEAAHAYGSAVTLTGRTGDRLEEARALSGLAHLDRAAGRTGEARRSWQACAEIYESLGVPAAAEVRALLASLA
ncbi:hypothetical protein Ssi03_30750 [Sphaerisporangium siamense]|uniref:Tetratricopeptide (TPR) repeat protein n=1 Tax=Sphaerisporangium siamense TaxID=795645 RepID=A0A7W7DCC6_9ACTN|nr:tetratricopeptide repeat protein [Sphaerisporangium siamense]MBB4704233.1 tetratricopeptide (TPR) repeat protein [Sphaerisporangium siamense]GII85085.1 hypothetical protein Ssi03_30750 [Sphaerisporangium siamense]